MKIATDVLKEMTSNAVQGAGNDKLIPITQLIGIKKDGSTLKMTTTDATNYFYVYENIKDNSEDFDVALYVEQFSKLISKLTCKEVELDITDSGFEIKGNGTYILEMPVDENGDFIKYPDPYATVKSASKNKKFKTHTLDRAIVIDAINICEPSLSTTSSLPSITNYYVGDKIISTNRNEVACIDTQALEDNTLISAHLMTLLSIMDEDVINYYSVEDAMIFETACTTIYSKSFMSVDEFPVDRIIQFIQADFKSICKVDKNELIALLERIALFVNKYDNKAIDLHFTKDGIQVSNKSSSGVEKIFYTDSKNFEEYECTINIDILLTQLKAYPSDVLELHYNNPVCIKFVDGNIVQIIALMFNVSE